jgi:hypothetical protein
VPLNKEIKRCTVVAGVFPGPAALPRLAGGRLARADFRDVSAARDASGARATCRCASKA